MKKYPQPLDTQGLAGFFLLKRYMKGTRKSVKIYSGAYPQPAPAYWDTGGSKSPKLFLCFRVPAAR